MLNAGRIMLPTAGNFICNRRKRDLARPEYAVADTHDEMLKAIRKTSLRGYGDQDRCGRSEVHLQR